MDADLPAAALEASAAAPYVPSPMDYTLLYPQLISIAVVALCLAYWQVILVPTAQVKYNLADKEKRAYIKELKEDNSRPVEQWLMKQWLKPMGRPRGDQTDVGLKLVRKERPQGGDGAEDDTA